MTGNMILCKLTIFVISFTARFTGKTVYSSVFRLMPIFHLSTRENFATKLTREAPTFVFSHVQLIVVPVVVSFPANAAEVGILSSVMLGMSFQNQISSQRFYCTL